MRAALFSVHNYEIPFLDEANAAHGHELVPFAEALTQRTVGLARGFPAVCAFANDTLDEPVLQALHDGGTRLIALRAAGFNHVDLAAADALGLTVLRVPAYSPHAIAEHTVGLMLMLNRKLHRAFNRVREHNFALDGLLGFDFFGRTVGLVGTGRIGEATARILHGFGCRLLAFDPHPNPAVQALGARYVDLPTLLADADVITLHCPLTPDTHHLIDAEAVARMKPGVMLINTSRGAVVDARALLEGLKSGRIGHLGLDVYEEEENLFFKDLSAEVIQDDLFARLLTFPNVVVTAHQAFFTREAMQAIAATTLQNLSDFEQGRPRDDHRVTSKHLAP